VDSRGPFPLPESVDSPGPLVSLQGVRINDRRRFHPDGEPRDPSPDDPGTAAAPDAVAPPASQTGTGTDTDALLAELVAARARVNELARGLQESVRDREAFKERLARENERLRDVQKGEFALPLIEAIDALDLSLQADDGSPFAQGVRLIRDDMVSKLGAQGIERLQLVGQPFDPNRAEAAEADLVAHPSQDGRVLSEVRAGYALNGRVVRPARVRVGRYVQPARA
jgi:molecular chaperone GrpE